MDGISTKGPLARSAARAFDGGPTCRRTAYLTGGGSRVETRAPFHAPFDVLPPYVAASPLALRGLRALGRAPRWPVPVQATNNNNNLQRPPFLRCRHSRRPRPARPMPTAPPCIRQRPACRMSTSRGSGNGFAAAQAQQSHQQQSASTGTASKQTAALGRPSAFSVLQHVL